jgi:carbonic anhydrase
MTPPPPLLPCLLFFLSFFLFLGHHEEDAYSKALASNRAWAQKMLQSDARVFERMAQGQQPGILWLGCADSRVPETTLLGLAPGDVFVHRNIANLYVPTDISAACVLEYGIKHLGVRHVVLCGHTHCGGVKGALGSASLGTLDVWLAPLRALRLECADELAALGGDGGDEARVRLLVERSVQRGVQLLRQNPHVLHAMHTRGLRVHGVVYNIATGLLEEVAAATATCDDADSKAAGAHLFNIQ